VWLVCKTPSDTHTMYPRIAVELSLELDQAREEIAQGSSVVHICQAVGLAPSNVGVLIDT
jgi:hypothetical protein